jgi:ArsR family transcriptional regulator
MATARCCPADCALRSDWEDELRAEKEMFDQDRATELHKLMKLLSHPLRLKIILMLLKRDHCVCEFFYVFEEPPNLISCNLKKLKDGGLIESCYRSNHKIYKVMAGAEPALI